MKMQILEIGLLILAAYLGGLIARRLKIGEVVGQILGGILIGPHFLELVRRWLEMHPALSGLFILKPIFYFYRSETWLEYGQVLENYHFFVFLFLGLIAFSLGEELHLKRLRSVGSKATVICLFQGLLTFALLFVGFRFILGFDIIISFIVSSIGIATAPALTFALMNKLRIEGKLRSILANIMVLDAVIEITFFSVFLTIAMARERGIAFTPVELLLEVVLELFWASLIGVAIFLVLKFTLRRREKDLGKETVEKEKSFLSTVLSEHPTPSVDILMLIIGTVSVGISVAIHFNLPFLLTAVVAGFLISNYHHNEIFDSLKIDNVMPIMNLFFFAIIGASVRVESFNSETLFFTLVYLVFRSLGKFVGSWAGTVVTDQGPKIRAALPKLMLPQAGMAAVETILVATVLQKDGFLVFDTIFPALVIFELGGAYLAEKTLVRWKNWIEGEKEALRESMLHPDDYTLSWLVDNRGAVLMANTREQALFELAQVMVKHGIIHETAVITDGLAVREKLGSTAIGQGTAIPHCRVASIDRPFVAVGIAAKPIAWNAPDGQPVDLFFLILTPDRFPEQHLKVVRIISVNLRKQGFGDEIRQAVRSGRLPQWFEEKDQSKD